MNSSTTRERPTRRTPQTELSYIPTKEQLGVLLGIIRRLKRQNMRSATFEAFEGMLTISYIPYRDPGEARLRTGPNAAVAQMHREMVGILR